MTEYSEVINRLRTMSKASAALTAFFPQSNGNAMVKLLDEAADAIEELVGKTDRMRWISVEERLPEANERVLVYHGGYGITVGHRYEDGRWHIKQAYPAAPKFWMPLPEPPKEET